MSAGVYKICACRDRVKCRHPWWFSFTRRGEKQLRKSLDVVLEKHIDSKTVAQAEAERLRTGIRDDTLPARTRELLGLPPSKKSVVEQLTVGQLLDTYHARHLTGTATVERRKYEIGAILRMELPRPDGTVATLRDWPVRDLTVDAIERLREASTAHGTHQISATRHNRVGGKVAANRRLRLLRAAFNWAIDKDLIDRTPFRKREGGRSTVTYTQELSRSRRLGAGEGERLLAACGEYLRSVVEMALETGCRKGEILGLTWSQVRLDGKPEIWLPAGTTKTGKARRVPISSRLRAILEMRRDALRTSLDLPEKDELPGNTFVFGNEIGQRHGAIKTAWTLALQRAGITDLHFHDLRREAGSRWMEAGVPLATIQKWLGHTNISQTSTYLATTTAGEHEAMRRFEERVGRLIPIDKRGETPPRQQARSDKSTTEKPQ